MANHGSRCGHLEFDEEEARLVVDLPVQAGGEVLLDYGARPSDEFLLQYGFAPERNPHDGATLRLPCGTRYSFGWEDSGIRTSSVVRAACEQSLAVSSCHIPPARHAELIQGPPTFGSQMIDRPCRRPWPMTSKLLLCSVGTTPHWHVHCVTASVRSNCFPPLLVTRRHQRKRLPLRRLSDSHAHPVVSGVWCRPVASLECSLVTPLSGLVSWVSYSVASGHCSQ